jgi:hypothetical protein
MIGVSMESIVMVKNEIMQKVNDFIIKNHLWVIVATITLFCVWLNPVLFLDYMRVVKWPFVMLIVLGYFRKEISILTTEKLKSFFIKAFGVEFQGSLAEQNRESKPISEPDSLPNEMIQEKINELSQTHEILSTTIDALRRNLAVKEIEIDFERIYNRIFGSQFSLLENIIVNGGNLKLDQAIHWYMGIQNQYTLFKEWNATQYLAFLQNNALIEFDSVNNIIKISEKGKAFVKYIRLDMMYAGYKPF